MNLIYNNKGKKKTRSTSTKIRKRTRSTRTQVRKRTRSTTTKVRKRSWSTRTKVRKRTWSTRTSTKSKIDHTAKDSDNDKHKNCKNADLKIIIRESKHWHPRWFTDNEEHFDNNVADDGRPLVRAFHCDERGIVRNHNGDVERAEKD